MCPTNTHPLLSQRPAPSSGTETDVHRRNTQVCAFAEERGRLVTDHQRCCLLMYTLTSSESSHGIKYCYYFTLTTPCTLILVILRFWKPHSSLHLVPSPDSDCTRRRVASPRCRAHNPLLRFSAWYADTP
ncbi:hypothetical protein L227DRAFT_304807 [Lentinus tigrinus ALCF2SS1-6]|uniref:Uncharacterized protein n=1 Tax=Lentinus tigrinus ALCF2SS1-6 TaxID=1328759 RepID=A0A5C2RUR2_9APHY|nr:hypothetical protein L227DRAFT_304807 [Lentinus tigrinus ALCF2SS1-6]